MKLVVVLVLVLLVGLIVPSFSFEVVIQRHSALYPRVGNPILTTLPNGSILSVFIMNGEYMGIYGKVSNDLHVWSNEFLIKAKTIAFQPFSCALFTAKDKTFLIYDRFVFWNWDATNNSCSIWMLESDDNGETWANDRWIGSANHDYAVGSYSICQTMNGSWVYPFSWFVPADSAHSWGSWSCGILRSDDEGLSWYQIGVIPHCLRSLMNVDEPSVVQLSNGSLYCVMRSYILDDSHHVCSLSNDLGKTWGEVKSVPEMFAFDTTPALVRYGNLTLAVWVDRAILSFYNSPLIPRMPLVIAFSNDDCATWRGEAVVDSVYGMEINDVSLAVIKNKIVVAYRRYNWWYLHGNDWDDDSVIQVLSLINADYNSDGTVNILDAILLCLKGQSDIFGFAEQYGRSGWFWSSEN